MKNIKVKAQLMCSDEIAFGPGKADLLEAIDRERSISAAGRALGISYRRTWQLVDVMNRCWAERLVETLHGGGKERGARVTTYGWHVLASYRALEARLAEVTRTEMSPLLADMRSCPLRPKDGARMPSTEARDGDPEENADR